MPQGRPGIPVGLQRDVLVEAGHRCAIPTCRTHPVEIAHIVPWAKVRRHEMVNLIALCPTCHARYDRGEIDRKAMQKYKLNLTLISSLYSSLERRVLEHFAKLRDLNITAAFPLHLRARIGEERFEEFVRKEHGEDADKVLNALEFAMNQDDSRIALPTGNRILLSQLMRDGYLSPVPDSTVFVEDIPFLEDFELTSTGKDFVDRWITADNLNPKDFGGCGCDVGESFAVHLREHVNPDEFDPIARALRAVG